MVESINSTGAATPGGGHIHFCPPHSSGVSQSILDATRSAASISTGIPLVNTHVYSSPPSSSDASFSVRSVSQSLQGSAGVLRENSLGHSLHQHTSETTGHGASPGGLESIQSSLSIPQTDAPGSLASTPNVRRMMPARGSWSSSGHAAAGTAGIQRSVSAISQHSNAGGAGATGAGGVAGGGMAHDGTKSVEGSASDFRGSRAMTLDEVGEEDGPIVGETAPSWIALKLAHWKERWKFHRKDMFENPDHAVWWVYDCVIRCADIYNMIALTTLLGFVCDFEFSNFIPWFFIDILHLLAIPMEVNRPKFDRFGQLITKPAEKRQAYFSEWSSRLEILAMLPADWAIVLWCLSTNNLRRCGRPMYVYNHNVFSPTPLPMQTATGIRFEYDPNDIPKQLFYYAIARAIRLFRCGRTFEWMFNLRISKMAEAASRLMKTLVFSVFLSHVDSCMFWILSIQIESKRKWTVAADVIFDEFGNLTPFSERYSRNFYGAQKALYFMPREIITTPEIIFQCVEMLLAAVLYGSIFGNLASIVRSLDSQAAMDKAAKSRNFKRSFLIKYMRSNRFPPTLQLKILEQEEFEWVHKRGMDTDRLFLELPKSIREEVNIHLYHALISNVPIFKEHAPEVFKVAMCQRMSSISVTKDFYVCKAGEAGNEMYFLRHGSVEILTPDESRVLVTLGTGAFFGEVALFMPNNRRTATARTTADTELCVLKKEDFDDILRSYPEMIAVFQQEIERRAVANKKRQEEEESKQKAEEMRKRGASSNVEQGRLKGRHRTPLQSGNSSALLSRFTRQPSASFSNSKRGTLGRSTVAPDAPAVAAAATSQSPMLHSSTRRSSSFHDAEADAHRGEVGGSAHAVGVGGPRRTSVSVHPTLDKTLGSVTSVSSRGGGASRWAIHHHVAALTGPVIASTGIVTSGGGNQAQEPPESQQAGQGQGQQQSGVSGG